MFVVSKHEARTTKPLSSFQPAGEEGAVSKQVSSPRHDKFDGPNGANRDKNVELISSR